MNIKTLNVFYGEDFLPYKDNAREVHYPNVGSDFQGANEISEIHFYTDRIGDTGSTTFAVAIELPNGKIGSKVIAQSEYDEELHENYVVLPIDDFITRYVGNVTISLRGYQGDIELEYDEDTQLYVLVGGTPITAVTGGIKLRVNQVPQGLQGEIDEEVTLQQLLGLVATKLDIDKGIVILGDISTANLSGYEVGQLFYDKNSGTYYEKTATSPYYKKADNESGVLGSANILCKNGDSALTISELNEIYGSRSYFVYRYLDKDILFNINQVAQNDYNCIAFDIEGKSFYEKAVVSGSALPNTILIPANKIEIASKAFLVSNYVPYNGANADVDLGEQKISAKQLNLPQGKLRTDSVDENATLLDGKFLYDNEHTDEKEDERAISSVKYVLENNLQLTSSLSGTLTDLEYAYASKPNAVIIDKDGIKTYRLVNDRGGVLYFACFNDYIDRQADGNNISFGWLLTIDKSTKAYQEQEIAISVYSKSQAKDKFATNFTASLDTSTYVLTFTLKNANGVALATQTLDLPLESIVTSMTYYDEYTYGGTTYHNVLVIVLATTSVPTIVPVGSLISGLEHEALVEVSDISTPLTASQLALLEYPNAMITYGYNVYLKAEDNGTYITLSVPYISLATNSGHEEATRKFIVVTKSSGAMALTSDTTSFYNKSQADSLLGEKADASSVVTDSDIETLGGAVNRIRKGNTWNVVAQEVNMSTTPKVVQSVADLPADNDGYLYVVLDNGYLYSWDEENQEWAQQYQYTSDLLTITEVQVGDDDYSYIEDKANDNRPIQVASAKKDGNGDVIDETYAKISDLETIDERLDNHDTDIAKLKKDVDYAMKYPLLYGTPTTDTEEEVGLTTSQLPATTLPKGLINYVGGMSQKVDDTIINAPVEKLSSKGFNIWDEEIRNGYYNTNGTFTPNASYIACKNAIKVIPNATYYWYDGGSNTRGRYCWYDNDDNFISTSTSSSLLVAPANARYLRFDMLPSYGNTYNHDICINLSGTMNGTYLPYQAPSEYPIPAEVQALDGYGLGIDDTLYNYIDFERKKFAKKVVSYTFTGNEAWNASASAYTANITGLSNLVKKASNNSDIFSWQINNAGLKATSGNELYTGRNTSGIAVITNGNIFIGSDDYANISNLVGKTIVFELAEPTETDISEYLDRDFPNENLIDTYQGGEVEFENDNDMSVPYSFTYQYKVE